MTKKKKKSSTSGLKSVERGFATTSLPSRTKQLREEEAGGREGDREEGEDGGDEGAGQATTRQTAQRSGATSDAGQAAKQWSTGGVGEPDHSIDPVIGKQAGEPNLASDIDSLSPEAQEEQYHQNLVEKYRSVIERKASRVIKELEHHKRLALSFSSLRLKEETEEIFKEIKRLAQSDSTVLSVAPLAPSDKKSHDDLLVRLGVTYEVLKGLGFRVRTIEQCLRSIKGVDYEEALDWMYLHCGPEDLPNEDGHVDSSSEDEANGVEKVAESPMQNEPVDAISGPVPPTTIVPSLMADLSDESEDDLLDVDLTRKFVELNLRLSKLETARRRRSKGMKQDGEQAQSLDAQRDAVRAARLKKRISAVSSEYYFDATAARNALVLAQHQGMD